MSDDHLSSFQNLIGKLFWFAHSSFDSNLVSVGRCSQTILSHPRFLFADWLSWNEISLVRLKKSLFYSKFDFSCLLFSKKQPSGLFSIFNSLEMSMNQDDIKGIEDKVLIGIESIKTLKRFTKDVTTLKIDGANMYDWLVDIDQILLDLFDQDSYLQNLQPTPLNKNLDKTARLLIHWTIPSQLRPNIKDAISAHAACKALSAQFNRNNRSSHMASLIELFNIQHDITQPEHLILLYDKLYRQFHQLIYNGFKIDQDTLFGALFQIAVGRSNFEIYKSISKCLDDRPNAQINLPTSKEVVSIARTQFENLNKSQVALQDNTLVVLFNSPTELIPSSTFDHSNTQDTLTRALENLKLSSQISNQLLNSAFKSFPQQSPIIQPQVHSLRPTSQPDSIVSKANIEELPEAQAQIISSQSIRIPLETLPAFQDAHSSQSAPTISNPVLHTTRKRTSSMAPSSIFVFGQTPSTTKPTDPKPSRLISSRTFRKLPTSPRTPLPQFTPSNSHSITNSLLPTSWLSCGLAANAICGDTSQPTPPGPFPSNPSINQQIQRPRPPSANLHAIPNPFHTESSSLSQAQISTSVKSITRPIKRCRGNLPLRLNQKTTA
ncbi:hypothetical protein O181_025259 [Austropuccinia psidii MF-1]|uniref:Uncharacterized protein n=1 Tax=Austropuccinia psidii MF-1 TaxID=1389203 RepID=A0A9Q3H0G4_9BASI|nr:hypothetical protein [Austropuccinia psidii MF-1]